MPIFKAMENHRIGQRISLQAPVELAIIKYSFWAFLLRPQFSGTLSNISVRGIQLMLSQTLQPGTALKLWIRVDHRARLYNLVLRGEVMWSTPAPEDGLFLAGIQLGNLDSPEMEIWAASTLGEIRDFNQ